MTCRASTQRRTRSRIFGHRWNIQPKDLRPGNAANSWSRLKPIVFYLDDAFPALCANRSAAACCWNKAFEKIGFKNVMHIEDFPKDDPEFDPDNLNTPASATSRPPWPTPWDPWVDPAPGEIINASVLMYNDV